MLVTSLRPHCQKWLERTSLTLICLISHVIHTGISEMFLDPDRRSSPFDMYSQFKDKEMVFVTCHFPASFNTGYWRWTLSCDNYFDPQRDLSNWPVNATNPQNSLKYLCPEKKKCKYSYTSQISFHFKAELEMCFLTCFLIDPHYNGTLLQSPLQEEKLLHSSTIFLHNEVNSTSRFDVQMVVEKKNRPHSDEEPLSVLTSLIYAGVGIVIVTGVMLVGIINMKKGRNESRSFREGFPDSATELPKRYLVLNKLNSPSREDNLLSRPHFALETTNLQNSASEESLRRQYVVLSDGAFAHSMSTITELPSHAIDTETQL